MPRFDRYLLTGAKTLSKVLKHSNTHKQKEINMYDETMAKLDALQATMLDKVSEIEASLARIELRMKFNEDCIKATETNTGVNFLLIDEILESYGNVLDILVEESPDVEMLYSEDDEGDEEPKTATILKLVINNTKDEE